MFVNALDADAAAVLQRGLDGKPLPFVFENQAYDAEFSNLLWCARHLFSYGGNYRHNNFDLSFTSAARTGDEGGVYAQDQIFLSERCAGSSAAASTVSTVSQGGVLAADDVSDQAYRLSQTATPATNQ